MIGQIRGVILQKQPPELLIDVHGVGYEIQAPMSTFYQLPDVAAEVTLLTHFVVREDAHHLYGFYTSEERKLFRTLLKVNGIGPKLGLTILSSVSPEEFVRTVMNNDTGGLVSLPGVGKKTAERIIIEMRDKLNDWYQAPTASVTSTAPVVLGRQQALQDAVSALIALGYKQVEALRVVGKVDDGSASSEDLIRQALREMM